MSRRPRLHVPGGFCHVTLRGNHRRAIFRCQADRDALDELIGDVSTQVDTSVHAYCWMGNHLHAVLRAGDRPVSAFMQRIATRYARYYQRRLKTTGHLFERRFHSVPISTDRQLLAAVRYVHLNPVRATIVADPALYPWSGHRGYLGQAAPGWLVTTFVLGCFGVAHDRARYAYAEFVAADDVDDAATATPSAPPDQPVAGKFGESHPGAGTAAGQACAHRSLEELIRHVCAEEGVPESALRGPSRNRRLAGVRARIAADAVESGVATMSEVARRFDRHVASLAKAASRREQFRGIQHPLLARDAGQKAK